MIRTVEMSEQLEEIMEILTEQRIEKQKTGHKGDRIELRVKIQKTGKALLFPALPMWYRWWKMLTAPPVPWGLSAPSGQISPYSPGP